MDVNLTLLEQTRNGVFLFLLIGLAILLFVGLARAIKGPRVADRLVAVNMIGTIVMVMLAILALLLGEDFLLDICLIYAMASFLAVIVLSKVYIGIYEEKRQGRAAEQSGNGAAGRTKEEAAEQTGNGVASRTKEEEAAEQSGNGAADETKVEMTEKYSEEGVKNGMA